VTLLLAVSRPSIDVFSQIVASGGVDVNNDDLLLEAAKADDPRFLSILL
jgi:hypothetical protein